MQDGRIPAEYLQDLEHPLAKRRLAALEPLVRRTSRQVRKVFFRRSLLLEEKNGEILELEGLIVALAEENALQADLMNRQKQKISDLNNVLGTVLKSFDRKSEDSPDDKRIILDKINDRISIKGNITDEGGGEFERIFLLDVKGNFWELDYNSTFEGNTGSGAAGDIYACLPSEVQQPDRLICVATDSRISQVALPRLTSDSPENE
jgi:hypothetical protein